MTPPPEHDDERVAIITGASQGIGAGLTRAYRELGYAVIATARSIEPSEDPRIVTVAGDIAESDTAQRVVEEALERFGRIDTLINNAGIYIGKPFTDYTLEDFNALIAVNLAGFFHMTTRTPVSLGVIKTPIHDDSSYAGMGALHPWVEWVRSTMWSAESSISSRRPS